MTALLPDHIWKQIKPIFARAWPNEAIVAVYADRWEHFENVAPNPMVGFALSEADNARLLASPPQLLLHSHPNGDPVPSDEDTLGQLATGWNWGIVAVHAAPPSYAVTHVAYPECWGDGVEIPPLEGRSYLWGVRDCWTLCRDYLRLAGHSVPNCPRAAVPCRYPKGHWGHAQFEYWPRKLGFRRVDRDGRRPGDIVLMCYAHPTINHMGVWLGDGRILHQNAKRTSQIWEIGDEERFVARFNCSFIRWPAK